MNLLQIENDGPLIRRTNFWETEAAANGRLFLSTNAGAFRLLVPASQRPEIAEMRKGARHVVISILPPERWEDGTLCLEWMVEDGSQSPYAIHLSPGALDRIPGADDVGKEWAASVWELKNGRPHKSFERPAYFQIVPKLPWLRRIE